ncbi:hypothetical protein NC651_035081 [Populus alba x Populus x berolinensis]|nr:hypothetical protein NC651_035081 [Populus alba x Populus x berolinensis]
MYQLPWRKTPSTLTSNTSENGRVWFCAILKFKASTKGYIGIHYLSPFQMQQAIEERSRMNYYCEAFLYPQEQI